MYQEPEINALSRAHEALQGLDRSQIKRIIEWLTSYFRLVDLERPVELDQKEEPVTVDVPVEPMVPVETAPEVPVEAPPVKKRRGRRPKIKVDAPAAGETPVIEGFRKYETIEDLFFAANARTVASKILLVAAYLQEKFNYKEFSSFEINSRLKKVNEGVKNITTSINSLMTKKPPLLIQTKKQGTTKQAKRKFRVTEEGLRIARNYLTEKP